MSSTFQSFKKLVASPLKFGFFLFTKLPSAFFSGVRVIQLEEDYCEVIVPYKWFSQNPFQSTYFACLSMAAELSTGALALGQLYKKNLVVSMLVVKSESEFFKKAIGKTIFRCENGNAFKQIINEAITTGEAKTVTAKSIGKNLNGDIVAVFSFTWSFKAKQKL